jgi:hypothetical protein
MTTKPAADLADGEMFSVDGGVTWRQASGVDMTWGGTISAYARTSPRNVGNPRAGCVRLALPADGLVTVA